MRETRAFAAALVLYGAFFGVFFHQSFFSDNYIAPSDSLDFGVAAYLSTPALWTDAMYSGYPIAADPQSLTWYPILHLFRLFGFDWNLFLIAAYVIASSTTFLFVRRLTGSNAAGAFSGLAYGFSGVMLGHIGHFNQIHAAAWVPLALYGLQLIREGRHRGGAAVAAVAVALMWLAGHPQVPVYTAYLAAALTIGAVVIDRPLRRIALARLGWSGAAMALGFALAAIMILPMIELGELSRRAQSNWEVYISKALPPWQLLGIGLPFAFGGFWHDGEIPVPYFGAGAPPEYTGYAGLLALALALAAPFVPSAHRRDARLWLGLTLVSVLLCLGAATPVGTLFFYAPGYASFRVPARHLFVVSLCLSVASGLVFAALTRRRGGWGRVAGAVAATFALLAAAFAVLGWRDPMVQALTRSEPLYLRWTFVWPFVLSVALIGMALAAKVLARTPRALLAFAVLFVALQAADLAMLHYRMPGYRFVYADVERGEAVPHPTVLALRDELRRTGERALATDGSKNPFLLPNLTRPWNVPAASGSGSLGIERYLDVLGMGGPGDVYPETLSAAHRGPDLFSIRYALVPQDSPLAHDLHGDKARWSAVENIQYYEDEPETRYTLFSNKRALPRAWCVPSVARMAPREALAAIRYGHLPNGAGEFDPMSVALVDSDDLQGWKGSTAAASRSEVLVDVRRRQYLVSSDAPCLLVIGEVYYPWWRASIDEADAEIARVNYTMVGVPVPAGSHVVRLRLEPRTVWAGGAISALAMLVWIGLIVSIVRRGDRSVDHLAGPLAAAKSV